MSQVQIRQRPLISSINTQQVAGSWFPTGYYGHFRAKPRADLCNYYRQLARPNPPKTFLSRQNSEATSHKFSQHDNRVKVENDPLVRGTQAGFGKRKAERNMRGDFDPFFIGWIPKDVDRNKYIDDNKTTSYANDYNRNSIPSKLLSDIQSIHSPSSSSPLSEVSVYSTVYKHGQPDNQQSKQIRQETFQRYLTTQKRRAQLQKNERSINVASCLVWNNTDSENETTRTKMNVDGPIGLKSSNNFHDRPKINQQKPYYSQSMQMTRTMDQPRFGATTSQEYYTVKVVPRPQATTSFERTHTNSMQCLISKYM